jgi:phosphoserine phosphatase
VIKEKMSYVITFVASDARLAPLENAVLKNFLPMRLSIGGLEELHPQKACDFFVNKSLTLQEIKDLRRVLSAKKIDVFCLPLEGRRKKLLVSDMDATIVVGETLDELSAFAGVKEQVEEITRRAMNGEMDFHTALTQRVALLEGLFVGALEETYAAIQVMPGAHELVSLMKENGAKTVLVTGGFTYFAEGIANEVGFDHVHGNTLEIIDNTLSGRVLPPIMDKNSKLAYLQHYAVQEGLDLSQTLAIGDGANDLPMLEAAGLGIGYHPKSLLQEKLLNVILHGDLSAALYAQGFKF